MDPSNILLKLLAVFFLVGVNAFFVAAEFVVVAVRRARIEQRIRAGDKRAHRVMQAVDHPDNFISAAQLGITVASIAIGYIAEGAFHDILSPLISKIPWDLFSALTDDPSTVSHVFSTIITLLIVTYLHVVIGEQVPEMISIQRAELVALWTVRPTQWFGTVLRPLIRFMSGSAAIVTRLLGLEASSAHNVAHTREEIGILVEQSQQEGMVEVGEEEMIHGVFEFGELIAREVMTPRRDIVALPVTATRAEVIDLVIREGHSRTPVYDDNVDNITGVLLTKDLLKEMVTGDPARFDLRSIVREPYFVPDTKPVADLMSELRSRTVHLAIVLDEFGGTEGLVTLEDLLEQIVGDIYDEYDQPEVDFTDTLEGHVIMDGGTSISEVNERLELRLPEEDFDTIGGYIFGELGRVPIPGDRIQIGRLGELRVDAIEDRRITSVRYIPSGLARTDAESEVPGTGRE